MTIATYAGQGWSTDSRSRADRPPLSFGVLYPQNDLVAVIDDEQQAERSARALVDAGIPGEQVDIVNGRRFAGLLSAVKRRRSIAGRIGAWLSRLFSDDADYEQSLLDEARQNHALLVVHVAEPALVGRISGTVHAYGGHGVRYYGRGAIEDLG